MEAGSHTEESSRHFQYAYGIDDRVNPVQETSGTTVLANILTGMGIDEFFTRTDVPAATTSHFLPDALGSALALADSTGAVQTEYTYEPFGRATATGVSNTNPFQYTGRENDGTGLYYYRARYYHPGLQRFIGEDPYLQPTFGACSSGTTIAAPINLTDVASKDPQILNMYGYVNNNPIKFVDPLGLYPPPCPGSGGCPCGQHPETDWFCVVVFAAGGASPACAMMLFTCLQTGGFTNPMGGVVCTVGALGCAYIVYNFSYLPCRRCVPD